MSRTRQVARVVELLVLALLALGRVAMGATTVALNTGYDNGSFAPYPPASQPSTTNDNYWITIASFPNLPVAPAWVLKYPGLPWAPAIASTNWIGPRNTVSSAPITAGQPNYAIFRKCFCLLPNYKNPSLTFQVLTDDASQAWFNSQLNVALPPSPANYGGPPRQSLASSASWFHQGTNCIYLLLEDVGGWTGFDLAGTIQADGLDPLPATGANITFRCPCNAGVPTKFNDEQVVTALRKIAEERRLKRTVPPGRRPN